jgi:hypothetical protein
MATGVLFNVFQEDVLSQVHDFNTPDDFRVILSNTAPDAATDTVAADITEISAGNGYTAGGIPVTLSLSRTGSVAKVDGTDNSITASGAVGPFEYAILYNNTPVSKPLVGYWQLDASVTMASGDQFVVDFDATNGVLQADSVTV